MNAPQCGLHSLSRLTTLLNFLLLYQFLLLSCQVRNISWQDQRIFPLQFGLHCQCIWLSYPSRHSFSIFQESDLTSGYHEVYNMPDYPCYGKSCLLLPAPDNVPYVPCTFQWLQSEHQIHCKHQRITSPNGQALFVNVQIQLRTEFHRRCSFPSDDWSDVRLTDVDNTIRYGMDFVFIHVLLLSTKLVNYP